MKIKTVIKQTEKEINSGEAHRFSVLQFFGNLPRRDYDRAIEAYTARIEFLKGLIEAEGVSEEHFYYKMKANLVSNAKALIEKMEDERRKGGTERGGMEEGGMEEGGTEREEMEEGGMEREVGNPELASLWDVKRKTVERNVEIWHSQAMLEGFVKTPFGKLTVVGVRDLAKECNVELVFEEIETF